MGYAGILQSHQNDGPIVLGRENVIAVETNNFLLSVVALQQPTGFALQNRKQAKRLTCSTAFSSLVCLCREMNKVSILSYIILQILSCLEYVRKEHFKLTILETDTKNWCM